jgi:hypothetical protein
MVLVVGCSSEHDVAIGTRRNGDRRTMAKRATAKAVETLKHSEAKRKNIPTAE